MDTQVLADAPASRMPFPPPAPAVLPRRPALHGAADFVSWTWEMVNAGYDDIGWSADGSRITIKKPDRLASLILPLFFRHSQYASWVRALNAYHFKKVGTGQWHHPCFHRDRPELLERLARPFRGVAELHHGLHDDREDSPCVRPGFQRKGHSRQETVRVRDVLMF